MNRSWLLCSLVLLLVYLTLVFCDENPEGTQLEAVKDATRRSDSTELIEEARRRRVKYHGLHHHHWAWHALAIAYLVKVKVVIVAFFVASSIFWGFRYFWPHKDCKAEIVREGPIVYDHGPSFSHHDHIPYSFGHSGPYDHSISYDHPAPFDHSYEASSSFDSISSDPYSSYSGSYSDTDPSTTGPDVHHVSRRDVRRPYMPTEEQIAEFMFNFLGLDSTACRRRFICEMEFRSRLNPLTSMAFRIVGRGFFEKYTNARNPDRQATSFLECAAANPECTVIEENFADEEPEEAPQEPAQNVNSPVEETTHDEEVPNSSENEVVNDNNGENTPAVQMEKTNEFNLQAERRHANLRRRRVGSVDVVATRILQRARPLRDDWTPV